MSVVIFGEGATREEKYQGVNQREKQTYYGAVNHLTFTVCSARICNGKF
jgi:hypothetical protein